MKKIQAIRGMNDILPDYSFKWEWLEDEVRTHLKQFGYQNLRTPILESTDLFVRSIGEVTDIVEKEMYTFLDGLNGESLTLRPEGTASSVRAAIEHNMTYNGPRRVYYFGPMFRHERPQKGRFRQFHQIGVEAFGFEGPDVDAEHCLLASELWKAFGLDSANIKLEINSLGSPEDRKKYKESLVLFLQERRHLLDEDSVRRIDKNPLRILDSKNKATQEAIASAPKLLDSLSAESLSKYERFKKILSNNGINFEENPNLVRGLDYYNDVVYEWKTDRLGSQGTICAGGRYDGLAEQIGGKRIPSCGFALGVERLLDLIEEAGVDIPEESPDVYLVSFGENVESWTWHVAKELRQHQLRVILHCGGGSIKNQMKKANSSKARFAVIIGDAEEQGQSVTLKDMHGNDSRDSSQQQTMSLDSAIGKILQIRE
ncbi:MAG: histidine--tRNA ligase [Betaproteobacteria bacterium]